MIEKYEFKGNESGIKLLILGAIHGNETAGPIAINKLINNINKGILSIKRGKLTVVPICNPKANRKDVRNIDENLNRVIKIHKNPKTYEQKLANQICPLIKENDIILDIHSTHCKGDIPFAFCDYPSKKNKKLINVLPVDYVLEGWPQIYANQGEIEDFSTERYAHDCENIATTLECGYHKADEAGILAYNAIINTLSVFNLIDSNDKVTEYPKKHILMKSYIIKKEEGQLCKEFKHLDIVKKDEPIARYTNGKILFAKEDGYILLPNLNAEIGTEWYYFGVDKKL